MNKNIQNLKYGTSITKNLLKNKGWKNPYPQYSSFDDICFQTSINDEWFVTLTYGSTNSISRDWNCQIDNIRHESVGGIELQTIEQFNDFMKLMDVDYNL